jgi:hypothetical protein
MAEDALHAPWHRRITVKDSDAFPIQARCQRCRRSVESVCGDLVT